LGLFEGTLVSANKGFLQSFPMENLYCSNQHQNLLGNLLLGLADNDRNLYAAAWGVFDNSGGLYITEQ
jgi:hypothetical protein